MKTDEIVRTGPCAKCPFRNDVPMYLHPGRRAELVRVMEVEGTDFHCHETTEYDDEIEDMVSTSKSSICAGAAIMLIKEGSTTQGMRIAERLFKDISYESMAERTGDRVWTRAEFLAAPAGATAATFTVDEDDCIETCSVVNDGCLAPAGYMGYNGVVRGTEAADNWCAECGEPVCDNCMTGDLCNNCAEWAEEEDNDG